METSTFKPHHILLQVTIGCFTIVLVWFAFVYYPRTINQYKVGRFPQKTVVAPVSASYATLPIERPEYRITREDGSDTYYVFIAGDDIAQYTTNKNGAQFALKNALSLENLCSVNVAYISASKLSIPQNLQDSKNC